MQFCEIHCSSWIPIPITRFFLTKGIGHLQLYRILSFLCLTLCLSKSCLTFSSFSNKEKKEIAFTSIKQERFRNVQ